MINLRKVKKDKPLALKATQSDDGEEEEDMAYLTRRFHKIVRKHGGFMKKGSTSRPVTTGPRGLEVTGE